MTNAQQPIIDTCDLGHKFAKLEGHPTEDGKARCPNCLAMGLDAERFVVKLFKEIIDSNKKYLISASEAQRQQKVIAATITANEKQRIHDKLKMNVQYDEILMREGTINKQHFMKFNVYARLYRENVKQLKVLHVLSKRLKAISRRSGKIELDLDHFIL